MASAISTISAREIRAHATQQHVQKQIKKTMAPKKWRRRSREEKPELLLSKTAAAAATAAATAATAAATATTAATATAQNWH